MLIPRFSLRYLLGLMTASGVFFLVVSFAVRGHLWALAVSIAVGSLAVGALLHALVFLLAWSLALVVRTLRKPERPHSPFATTRNPPQILAPTAPD